VRGDSPESLRVLLVTGGHPFEREPFLEVFEADPSLDWVHVEQPEAQELFRAETADEWDAVVLYDMPGIEFTRGDPPARFLDPPDSYKSGFEALLERGQGMVFLHHAVAGWPAWPRYAEILGGRFHYQPAELRGTAYPDSGYVFDVSHNVEILEPDHPVCAGLPPAFEITDELYLFPVFESDVVPLMRSGFEFDAANFHSADLAIRGQRNSSEGWTHPTGSSLVAWAHAVGNSPLVYLQFGDGPVTYADSRYRKTLGNAIRWVSSTEAQTWAAARTT